MSDIGFYWVFPGVRFGPHSSISKLLKEIEPNPERRDFYYLKQQIKVIEPIASDNPFTFKFCFIYMFFQKQNLNVRIDFLAEESYLSALQELSQLEDWEIFTKYEQKKTKESEISKCEESHTPSRDYIIDGDIRWRLTQLTAELRDRNGGS